MANPCHSRERGNPATASLRREKPFSRRRGFGWIPAFAGMTLSLLPSFATAMEFGMPLRCDYGTDCFIQNYVDTQPGEGWQDYHCGALSYNTHEGTDFRLPNFTWLDRNIPVIAAADGNVLSTRNSIRDINVRNIDPDTIKNVKCGNGVMLEHGGGWMSQYCHMKRGSIAVHPGDTVRKGEVLGYVGLSGNTEFPHLHFNVFHNKKRLDPFTGHGLEKTCGAGTQGSLWDAETKEKLTYLSPVILAAGVAGRNMSNKDFDAARHGKFSSTELPGTSPAMLVWVDIMGIPADSTITVRINAPGESLLKEFSQQVTKSQASYFYFTGIRNNGNLPRGAYTASITVTSPNAEPQQRTLNFTLN